MYTPEDAARRQLQVLEETIEVRKLRGIQDIFVQSALVMIDQAQSNGLFSTTVIQALKWFGTYADLLGAISAKDYPRLNQSITDQGYVLRTDIDRGWNELEVLAATCQTRIDSIRS
ncbi:hypothetical protein KBD71_01200 [Candidatus Woesebacteria bacterium]|nr:hypothetical protein [Candidatus Woesebacteria bacterium]